MPDLPLSAAITPSRLAAFAPFCRRAAEFAPHLDSACAAYAINTPRRVRDFLGEVYVESWGFNRLEEDLDYSSAAELVRLWPAHFPTVSLAQAYVRQPEKLADLVYEKRFGDVAPGDGWRYRGRGFLQVTFKANYAAMSKVCGVDLVAQPDLLATPPIAATCAAAWWAHRNLNRLADLGEITAIGRAINGGSNGEAAREAAIARASAIWRG